MLTDDFFSRDSPTLGACAMSRQGRPLPGGGQAVEFAVVHRLASGYPCWEMVSAERNL